MLWSQVLNTNLSFQVRLLRHCICQEAKIRLTEFQTNNQKLTRLSPDFLSALLVREKHQRQTSLRSNESSFHFLRFPLIRIKKQVRQRKVLNSPLLQDNTPFFHNECTSKLQKTVFKHQMLSGPGMSFWFLHTKAVTLMHNCLQRFKSNVNTETFWDISNVVTGVKLRIQLWFTCNTAVPWGLRAPRANCPPSTMALVSRSLEAALR